MNIYLSTGILLKMFMILLWFFFLVLIIINHANSRKSRASGSKPDYVVWEYVLEIVICLQVEGGWHDRSLITFQFAVIKKGNMNHVLSGLKLSLKKQILARDLATLNKNPL